MRHGIARISTDDGGILDIIDENATGFIIGEKDSKAFADEINHVVKYPQKCATMGKVAYEKYSRKFTLNRFEQRMVEILLAVSDQYKIRR